MDEWTLDGGCDQSLAVECYNDFLLNGAHPAPGYPNENTDVTSKERMEECI